MNLISALQFLRLNQVPDAWVDAVWDAEFTESTSMDNVIEEELSVTREQDFRILYQCLWTLQEEQLSGEHSQGLWAPLGEHGVSVKSLVAVLSYFVLKGKPKEASVEQRVSSLHAASIYLLVLGIPGSIANRVFHEILLDTCVGMTTHCWPQDSVKKRKKDNLKSSQADVKRAKPHRKETQEMEVDEDDDDDEGEEIHFSTQDLMKIRESVVILLHSLLKLLQTFSLKDFHQSANNCIQVFTKLLYFEPVVGILSFAEPQELKKMTGVPEMSFYGLKLLCSSKHGNQEKYMNIVFNKLLYVILMMNKGSTGRPTMLALNQATITTRDQTINFVCHLVDEMKEVGQPLLFILLQHFCFQMVDKSEFRMRGAQAVGMLTSQMGSKDYARFVEWVFRFSTHPKVTCRLFSVDVVMTLLEQPERNVDGCHDPELACFLPHKFLIQDLLFPRRNDVSPTVRSHTLACLSHCLELSSFNATRAVHDLFSTVLESECTEGVGTSSQHPQTTYRTLPFRTVEISHSEGLVSDANGNVALLLQRVQDSNANVRKSALQALVGLFKHDVIPMSGENLTVLSERSRDPAVSVKKKALQCMGELIVVKPDCSEVQKAWLQCVLPAVMDSEDSVQEKALEALEQVLLNQVKLYSSDRHMDTNQRLTWDLLGLLSGECQNFSPYFSRAFTIWSKRNKFTQTFLTNLISHTDADHSAAAWLLLSKVTAWTTKMPCSKIIDAWDNMVSSKNMSLPSCCHITGVLGDLSSQLNKYTKDRIIDDLLSLLKTFTLSLEMISAALQTLYQLGSSEDDVQHTRAFLERHCGELLSACESYLAQIILCETGTHDLNEKLMVKHLHTLGVASLHCPARVSKRLVLLVESVLTTRSENLAEGLDDLPVSKPLSQFSANSLSTKIRAHGVITLGKLCLQHQDLAQRYLPVFARELEVGTERAVRNNVLIVMCDLCVRYTNVVDLYIPNISACLRDDEAIIREQTVLMLTNLLQEEVIKWKGTLFFHFMVALVDPVPAIASLCEFCLLHLLLKKNPEMFSQHFIECIFHFNSYSKHDSYNKFPQSEREKVRFSLKGRQNREKRFRIYRFLLDHLTDAQRFNITNKINQNVLACFADKDLDLDADGAEILSETFSILSLKEMKLQAISVPASAATEEEQEEENMAKVVLQAAQKKAVSHVQKKTFITNTVPLIICLKNLLEQKRSPVLRDLMSYLQVTMQDYRSEVKEFFAGDEQLAAEVEFAMKRAEEEREMEEQMENCNVTGDGRTPTAQVSPRASLVSVKSHLPFTTPQPPRPKPPTARVIHTDQRAHVRSRLDDLTTSKSIHLEKTVMHPGAVTGRAISTPTGMCINLTFEEGFSAIFCDQGAGADKDASVLHMQSHDQRSSRQRQWNVQSPLRQKTKPKDR